MMFCRYFVFYAGKYSKFAFYGYSILVCIFYHLACQLDILFI